MHIDPKTLQEKFNAVLLKKGFSAERAKIIAQTFTETTFDGVFSHGINRFPRFIGDVVSGIVKPDANPVQLNGFNALEQWDGKRGPGISNALFCTARAVELAAEFGIGCVGLRNTNHWMRGGTYGWRAAEKGFLFLGWTNTLPNMPPWRGKEPTLGNNPFIVALPHKKTPVVLDMAMSQFSYGKLEWHKKCGTELPEYGGYDREGKLTKDPSAILETERILPIGLWKGSALSLVLDLTATLLSGGNTTREIGKLPAETDLSQVFIAIDVDRFLTKEQFENLLTETLEFNTSLNSQFRYPGQSSVDNRSKNRQQGIEIPDEIWDTILEL